MKLIDIAVNKNFKNQTLKDGNFYIVLEQKDILHPLFLKGRFTFTELNDYLKKYEESFKDLVDLILGSLSKVLGAERVNQDEDIICYVTDTTKMSMCLRCFIIGIEDSEFLSTMIEQMKMELLKYDIYIKIKS